MSNRRKRVLIREEASAESTAPSAVPRWAKVGSVAVGAGLLLTRLAGIASAAEHPVASDDPFPAAFQPGADDPTWQQVDDRGGSSGSGSSGSLGSSGSGDGGRTSGSNSGPGSTSSGSTTATTTKAAPAPAPAPQPAASNSGPGSTSSGSGSGDGGLRTSNSGPGSASSGQVARPASPPPPQPTAARVDDRRDDSQEDRREDRQEDRTARAVQAAPAPAPAAPAVAPRPPAPRQPEVERRGDDRRGAERTAANPVAVAPQAPPAAAGVCLCMAPNLAQVRFDDRDRVFARVQDDHGRVEIRGDDRDRAAMRLRVAGDAQDRVVFRFEERDRFRVKVDDHNRVEFKIDDRIRDRVRLVPDADNPNEGTLKVAMDDRSNLRIVSNADATGKVTVHVGLQQPPLVRDDRDGRFEVEPADATPLRVRFEDATGHFVPRVDTAHPDAIELTRNDRDGHHVQVQFEDRGAMRIRAEDGRKVDVTVPDAVRDRVHVVDDQDHPESVLVRADARPGERVRLVAEDRDGSVHLRVQAEADDTGPTPAVVPTATVQATPMPTATVEATATAVPTATAMADQSPLTPGQARAIAAILRGGITPEALLGMTRAQVLQLADRGGERQAVERILMRVHDDEGGVADRDDRHGDDRDEQTLGTTANRSFLAGLLASILHTLGLA